MSQTTRVPAPASSRWPLPGLLIAGAITVVVAALGVVWGVLAAQERQLQAAREDFQVAVENYTVAVADLGEALTAAATVPGLDGEVADPATVEFLIPIRETTEVPELPVVDIDAASADELRSVTARVENLAREARAATENLVAATEEVRASHERWLVDQARADHAAAVAELAAAITVGEDVLAGSESRVADNQVRQGLRDALDAAIRVRDTAAADDATLEDLAVASSAAREQVRALDGPRQAVIDAQNAWQAEADRVAAQQAAAAAAATQKNAPARKPGSGKPGGAGSSTTSGGAPGSTGTGSSTSSGDGSYWIEESTDACWVLDTSGNAWPC
ncbi:hypothetical protein KQI48_00870 [Cellulomonas hominis]|uniref:hypothetical protein n=1 Tax=Cellulomonas hominis TaxID=156981 RepID=UPI0019A6D045|nr:hypothetical protein [Cellulomonas hominis]MBD3777683.1 hypothetical protein [Micrococcales bacterium]MBU5421207.1 hypothetical protein [Cellulomonas hominis]